MNLNKLIASFISVFFLYSCAYYEIDTTTPNIKRHYYSSTGFALIYEDSLYNQKIVNKKLNNEDLQVMHSLLKINTPIKIINPDNSKVVEIKINKEATYPGLFNVVVSKKIAALLELDINNPYVEIIEVKKNKTFIAKKSKTLDEEKNVAEKAPIDEIKVDNITKKQTEIIKKLNKKGNFILVINDFYYVDSANNLRNELINKTKVNNIYVKKIGNNKYRLFAGPFENFNTLKTTYISLNNLGFENLNIYRE